MGGGTDLWAQQKSLYIRWHLTREIVEQDALVCMVLVPLGQSVELHPNQSGSGNYCGSKSYPDFYAYTWIVSVLRAQFASPHMKDFLTQPGVYYLSRSVCANPSGHIAGLGPSQGIRVDQIEI
jgi:hypothetical protein